MYFCLRTRARVLVSCVCQWSPAGIRRSQYDAVCFQSKTTQNSTSHKNRANPETIEPENRRPSERRAKKFFVENHCGFLPTCEVNGWESRAVRMFVCAGAAKCSILVRLCFSMRRDCTVQLDGHSIYDQRHRSCWGEHHQPTSSITVVMFLSSFRHYKSTRQCCCCQWNGIRCGRQTPTTMHFIRTSLSLSLNLFVIHRKHSAHKWYTKFYLFMENIRWSVDATAIVGCLIQQPPNTIQVITKHQKLYYKRIALLSKPVRSSSYKFPIVSFGMNRTWMAQKCQVEVRVGHCYLYMGHNTVCCTRMRKCPKQMR